MVTIMDKKKNTSKVAGKYDVKKKYGVERESFYAGRAFDTFSARSPIALYINECLKL